MKLQIRKGFGFGLVSGVTTTLGLIVGLDASTGSTFVVIAGIIAIAISDSLSDALGVHIVEEATYRRTTTQIWEATIATFFFKFIFALTFVVPFFFLSLQKAVIACIVWGLILVISYSYHLARKRNTAPYKAIFEHVLIMAVVIAAAYFVGKATAMILGYY